MGACRGSVAQDVLRCYNGHNRDRYRNTRIDGALGCEVTGLEVAACAVHRLKLRVEPDPLVKGDFPWHPIFRVSLTCCST